MNLEDSILPSALPKTKRGPLVRYVPIWEWLPQYQRGDLAGDTVAGLVAALMMVPQSMAYALLAGLPPQMGLYAGIVPAALYGVFGMSRFLAVGPVAVVSLLVAAGVSHLAAPGSAEYVELALLLALLVGAIQLVMGVAQLGFLINLLSHPVLSGFMSAAALLIGFSQLRHLLGVTIPAAHRPYQTLLYNLKALPHANRTTLGIGLVCIATLFYCSKFLEKHLRAWRVPSSWQQPLVRSGPLLAIFGSALLTWALSLSEHAGVKIVGVIPGGLPRLTLPAFDLAHIRALLPVALTISLVGFMESFSIATTLARKRHDRVKANQELIALGAANIGAAFTGGFPVAGSLSRSTVNYTAGANSGLAALITVGFAVLTVLFLLPLFHFLPQATLAAIIIVAVTSLIDTATFRLILHYSKADTASLVATFLGVMIFDIETGIAIGFVTALMLYLWRTSHPHTVVVGRVGQTEQFRSVDYFEVTTYPLILAVRIDQSLYFANTKYLETHLLQTIADNFPVKHLILVCSGVNFIDVSAMETLEATIERLRRADIKVYFAEVKSPVLERLKKVGFTEYVGEENFFLSTHDALKSLWK